MSAPIYFGVLAIFCIYCCLEGKREAWYYYAKVNEMSFQSPLNKINEHSLFALQRGVIIIVFSVIEYYAIDVYSAYTIPVYALCFSLMFSVWHNGLYYIERNKLSPILYSKGFFDNSNQSTAKMNFDFKTRGIMFLVGFIFMVFLYLRK